MSTLGNKDWRMSSLYKIVNKHGKRVTFLENSIQRKIRKNPHKRKRILKARQFGVSTGCILNLFDETIWNQDSTNVIIAHEQDAIKKLFRIVTRAYKFLPDELKPRVDRGGGSKYELYFPDINSRIYCDLESRGDTIQNLHISEAAFVEDISRIRATVEAVPLHGGVTAETTPNGLGNHFYDDWSDPTSSYANLFFPWYAHDEYHMDGSLVDGYTDEELELISKAKKLYGIDISRDQIAFRRFKRSELKALFAQEYPEDDQTCFLSTGDAVMDLVLVKQKLDACPEPIEEKDGVRIYKPMDKGGLYVIGADVAEGASLVSGDFSSATVFDAKRREQVATFHGRLKPSDFAHALNALAKRYVVHKTRWPLLAVERNNHGHACLLELNEHIKYQNLYINKDERPGWVTDRVTRPLMIDGFIETVESGSFKYNDRTMLKECLTLIDDGGKIQAADGKHDDTIISAAIGLQMCVVVGTSDVYDDIASKILL